MFTGLVQSVGSVESAGSHANQPNVRRLVIVPARVGEVVASGCGAGANGVQAEIQTPNAGDSICVSGCCLTVVDVTDEGWVFDVIAESISKTWIGSVQAGKCVNLEQASTPTTLLGGHVVQGHVDGLGTVQSVQTEGEYRIRLSVASTLMQFVVPKGSVTLDGVSLTIADLCVEKRWFEVALIPETLTRTTLGELVAGDPVHFEADCMVKAVVHWVQHYASGAGLVQ